MPLQFAQKPSGMRKALDNGLARFGVKLAVHVPGRRVTRYDLPILTLSLDDVQGRVNLNSIRPTRWRSVEVTNQGRIIGSDVSVPAGRGETNLLAYSAKDPRLKEEYSGWKDLLNLSQLAEHDYEPQLVRIPGLLVEAFRLKPLEDDAGQALLIPVRSASPAVRAGQVYAEGDFLDRLVAVADSFRAIGTVGP